MTQFQTVGIIGRYRSAQTINTVQSLLNFLQKQKITVLLDEETAQALPEVKHTVHSKEALAKAVDLLIVVGGDGSLLGAARIAALANVPVIGINRGTLGFLTDISPDHFAEALLPVLEGQYLEEKRFLLQARIYHQDKLLSETTALNDVVLMPGAMPHMIAFSTYINNEFMCSQRADGLIIASPTGSTAYALSAGGSILHPHLDAIALVPMFPHKLSSRPIVINGNSDIRIEIDEQNESAPQASCDGQNRVDIPVGGTLKICKDPHFLSLLHPKNYRFFETLREKLGWEESKL